MAEPDDARGAYPRSVSLSTPESKACVAASDAEIARCLAGGMSLEKARIRGAVAAASKRREQLGLPEEEDSYVLPAQRYRVDPSGRIIGPKKTRR